MPRRQILALHGIAVITLIALAALIATLRGELWPFDIRATLLMTASGLGAVILGWWPAWLLAGGVSARLAKTWHRLALWPIAIWALILIHLVLGPARGFAPFPVLGISGLIALYTVPAGIAVLLGSASRLVFARRQPFPA